MSLFIPEATEGFQAEYYASGHMYLAEQFFANFTCAYSVFWSFSGPVTLSTPHSLVLTTFFFPISPSPSLICFVVFYESLSLIRLSCSSLGRRLFTQLTNGSITVGSDTAFPQQ